MVFAKGHSQVLGVGAHFPVQTVSSRDLMEEIGSEWRFGIGTDWLEHNMGVVERRYADDDTLPSDMATVAAEEAIRNAGIDIGDIGALVFAGIDRDNEEPGTAHVVQCNIGAFNAKCVDITNACHQPLI